MKAVQFSAHGYPPEVVKIVDIDIGLPADDEVLIDVEATPIRFFDIYRIRGDTAFSGPQGMLGGIGVGRIARVGGKVTNFSAGDRVYLPRVGTWQEQIRVPAAGLEVAPRDGDPIQLSLVNSNLVTAHNLLKDVFDLEPGEWVLQDAANSSCGHYIIKLAKMWGFKTVNVVRRASLIDNLKTLGADAVVVDGPNLAADVMAATGNAKIRLAADMVAGTLSGRLAECLGEGGTVAVYGQVSGEPCQIPAHIMWFKRVRLIGFLGWRQRTPEEKSAVYAELSQLVTEGKVSAEIAGVYPFARVGDALALAAKTGEERRGKVILVPH